MKAFNTEACFNVYAMRCETLGDALDRGWTLGDTTMIDGRVPRQDARCARLHMARGKRHGEAYVDLHAEETNRYHVRQYLVPPEGWDIENSWNEMRVALRRMAGKGKKAR